MAIRVLPTASGAAFSASERNLLEDALAQTGHATLLVGSFEARDEARADMAAHGMLLGVDVETPSQWLQSLWELMGDGRALMTATERSLVMGAVVARTAERDLLPLRGNPGTVRLLARIARELLPFAPAAPESDGPSDARAVVARLLEAYRGALDRHGAIEPSEAAFEIMRSLEAGGVPRRARSVVLRGIDKLPAWSVSLLKALAGHADICVLLGAGEEPLASTWLAACGAEICSVEGAPDGSQAAPSDRSAPAPGCAARFLEVAGPHAAASAYVDALDELLEESAGSSAPVAVVSARPGETASQMGPFAAARGIALQTTRFVTLGSSETGCQLKRLRGLIDRLEADEASTGSPSEWWPAPELTDWLYSPLSGAGAALAREFDKKIRQNRAVSSRDLERMLQSIQGRARARREKMDPSHPYARVPVVAADVFSALRQHRPVRALKALQGVLAALPAQAWGAQGRVRLQCERDLVERALQALEETARDWGIDQEIALDAIQGMSAPVRERWAPAEERAQAAVLRLDELSCARPGSFAALLLVDVDTEHYKLDGEEGPLGELAQAWDAQGIELDAPALQQLRARRALEAARRAVLARVTHDRQAKDRYPAALWTMLRTPEDPVRLVGEEDLVRRFDRHGGLGMRVEHVPCMPPQSLSDAAKPYVELKREDPEHPGSLLPRPFSASQIEAYAGCPLCWLVSSRVRPQALDAGFGSLEKGNFVHDVLHRFYLRRIEQGLGRVTPENLEGALAQLRRAFDEVRDEHARGKTSSSAPLVALDAVERQQVDTILRQLEGAVRYEATIRVPFAPELLEYSFNKLDATYAGRPIGGRIDRVDTDVNGRAVIIDYKHRGDVRSFTLKDPTVPDAAGHRASDDPRWLPPHTQSLIYAQVLRRELGLDVRGALYFATKYVPQIKGAVSVELTEQEDDAGPIPGLKDGFPAEGGSMTFEELLDRVELTISQRLDELEAGVIRAAAEPGARCGINHGMGFERRDA